MAVHTQRPRVNKQDMTKEAVPRPFGSSFQPMVATVVSSEAKVDNANIDAIRHNRTANAVITRELEYNMGILACSTLTCLRSIFGCDQGIAMFYTTFYGDSILFMCYIRSKADAECRIRVT